MPAPDPPRSFTMPRRLAYIRIYRKAKGTQGVSKRKAIAVGLTAFFSGRDRRTATVTLRPERAAR